MNARYVIGFFLLLAGAVHAENVPEKKALQVATQFFLRQLPEGRGGVAPRKGASLKLVCAAEPYYYVFGGGQDGGEGFVVVSGDDRARPVLACSADGCFDTDRYPPNVAVWMEHYREELEYLVRENPAIPPHPEWDEAEPRSSNETLLYAASWDQQRPYNLLCPVLSDGEQALTGCVATSMAIVMKYHADRGFPAQGTGHHSYDDKGQVYGVDFGFYDWANMPDRSEDFTTDIQREAVAGLMYHCAVSLESDFGTDATGAYNWNTSVALTSFFGFDPRLSYIEKDTYSDSEWKTLIRAEIDAERLIIYDGHGGVVGAGGHSFLLTGYNDDDRYFFNWGWSGRHNGWYALSALTPNFDYNFSVNQGMIVGIQKALGGETFSPLRFVKGSNPEMIPDGIVKTESGNTFVISGGSFENRSYRPFVGSIGVALTDAGGNLREIIGQYDPFQINRGYAWQSGTRFIGDLYCTITTPYAATDRLRFVSSENGGQTWQFIYGAPGIFVDTPVGNTPVIAAATVRVHVTSDGDLIVDTPYCETLRAYAPSGRLLFEGRKAEGKHHLRTRLPHGIAIVQGDTWTEKIGIR